MNIDLHNYVQSISNRHGGGCHLRKTSDKGKFEVYTNDTDTFLGEAVVGNSYVIGQYRDGYVFYEKYDLGFNAAAQWSLDLLCSFASRFSAEVGDLL